MAPSYPSGTSVHPAPPTTPQPNPTPPPTSRPLIPTLPLSPLPGTTSHRRPAPPPPTAQCSRRLTPGQVIDQINGVISVRNQIRAGCRANNNPGVSDDEDILTGADLAAMYPRHQTNTPSSPSTLTAPNLHTTTFPNNLTLPTTTTQPPTLNQPPAPPQLPVAPAPMAPTSNTPTAYAFCDADADANTQQSHDTRATHSHG
ncbi:hypothetical protein JB92DRAFT_3126953 [Gautieria morchelliformis]|nr:hypothetical protein JB92DRAFT_3126953 [Gautieria morchelliformis]